MEVVDFLPKLQKMHRVFRKPLKVAELSAETNLFSATPIFARENGGPVLQQILQGIPWNADPIIFAEEAGLTPIIDYRVHRLMPGMYPAIPGWHCDAVPRKDFHSQPDYKLLPKDQTHFIMNLSTEQDGVSRTEFVRTNCTMALDEKKPIWQQVHKKVEHFKGFTDFKVEPLEQGVLYQFSSYDIHRATPATTRGWRAFFRLSYMQGKSMNQITTRPYGRQAGCMALCFLDGRTGHVSHCPFAIEGGAR